MESQSSISLLSKFPINVDSSTQQDGQGSDLEGFERKASFGPPKEWTSRPARHGVLGFLPTVVVLVVTLGFAGLILGVLLGRQCPQVQGGHGILAAIRAGYFVTSEEDAGGASSSGHLRVLTLSALASHLISDTSSILMTLVAYRVGASWLRHSKAPGLASVSQNPTPRQYGLLLRLMGSSSILAVAESCFYTVRLKKRVRLPRMFREALAFAVLVWVLSRLVGLIDLWLHTASSFSLEYVPTVQPSGIHMFGVAFNQSLCADLSAKYPEDVDYDFPGFPCSAAYVDFVRLEDWGNDLGFMVMTNSTSAPISIVTMEDNVLVAVPGPPVGFRGYAFTAPTFAVHANCESINHICQQDQQGITVNCTAAGYPQLPYVFSQTDGFKVTNTSEVKNRIFGVVVGRMMGREIGSTEVKAVTNNPTTMAIQLRWDPPEQGMGPNKETHSPGATNMTELAIETFPKPTLYASCSVPYLEAVVRWDGSNGGWSLLNTTLAAQQRTATLWLPVVWQFATEQLASNLMNVARTRPRGEVMAALNQELARLALGSAAGFLEPTAATDVSQLVQTMLGRYPIQPVLALLALLSLYAILALAIFFVSLWEKDESIVAPPYDGLGDGVHVGEPSSLILAQRWLVTPMPLVGSAFPRSDGRDPKRSVAAWAMLSAQDGDEKNDRLMIGVKNEGFGVVSFRNRYEENQNIGCAHEL